MLKKLAFFILMLLVSYLNASDFKTTSHIRFATVRDEEYEALLKESKEAQAQERASKDPETLEKEAQRRAELDAIYEELDRLDNVMDVSPR
jgi:ribosomal protein L29